MPYAVDEIRRVRLGELRQKIHILSGNEDNPVLLFLHGGPGVPNRHSVITQHAALARRRWQRQKRLPSVQPAISYLSRRFETEDEGPLTR